MPKKKAYTKRQTQRKFLTASNAVYDLIIDKFHKKSVVPMSFDLLNKIYEQLRKAEKRIK